jgi:hypothetical protein
MKTIAKPLVQHNQIFIVLSVGAALLLNQSLILWVPLLANLSALVFKKHPVMMVTRRWLKADLSVYAQEDPADLRFNQTIVVTLLSAALFLYALGLNRWALVPALMVLSACVVALMGFCVGCFIRFQLNQWRYRRLQS